MTRTASSSSGCHDRRGAVGQAVGMSGAACEAREKGKAKERQVEHAGTAPGKPKNASEKFSQVVEPDKGRPQDKAAAAVGMSRPALRKARGLSAKAVTKLARRQAGGRKVNRNGEL